MVDKLLIATRNPSKAVELKRLLNISSAEIHFMSEFLNIPDVEETGKTFEENALLKAKYAAEQTGMPAIADDSGLQVYELGGFPGVKSARCAGEGASDDEKVAFVLEKAKTLEDRSASFICVMCYYNPVRITYEMFRGECKGELLMEPVGIAKPNLQYDRIFFSHELGKTFSQVNDDVKGTVSHRGKAAEMARKYIELGG